MRQVTQDLCNWPLELMVVAAVGKMVSKVLPKLPMCSWRVFVFSGEVLVSFLQWCFCPFLEVGFRLITPADLGCMLV